MNRLLSLVALISFAACTDSVQNGLAFEVQDSDLIAGTFTQDGVVLEFEFARAGDRHTIAFRDASGRPLVETTLEGITQTTRVLDGKLVASGIPNQPDPTIEGDLDAQTELDALPEAALVGPLHDALVEAGIDEDLFAPQPADVAGVYDYDGRYFAFNPGDSRVFLSAAGASPTYIYLKNSMPRYPLNCASAYFTNLASYAWDYMIAWPYQSTYKTRYWWGATFRINTFYVFHTWDNVSVCAPETVLIRVSPYAWSP